MLLIQLFLVIFFLVAISRVVSRYRLGDLSGRGIILWILFWIIAGVVVLSPDSASYLARLVGVGRGADLVVYVALAGLFFIIFRLMVKIEKINKDITKIVRKIALDENKKEVVSLKENSQ